MRYVSIVVVLTFVLLIAGTTISLAQAPTATPTIESLLAQIAGLHAEIAALRGIGPITATTPITGWVEVEVTPPQCTAGRRLVFNHDADGRLTDVFLTWGQVQIGATGTITKMLRITQDPDGERLAVVGGWRKFRFDGDPSQSNIDALIAWAKNELKSNSTFACNTVGDYTVSVQEIVHTASAPVAGTEPEGWSEVPNSFYPAGDKLTKASVDHGDQQIVTVAWFWSKFTMPTGTDGCTSTVMTKQGKTDFWFQGASRSWSHESGAPTKEQIWELVSWWITAGLETEPNGVTCGSPGTYTVLWQDPALKPADARGRP